MIYISNDSANTISVISTASNTVIANIPVGKRPRGIKVSADSLVEVTAMIYTKTFERISNIALDATALPMGLVLSPDEKPCM